jgi:hypothetical protein
MKMSKLTVMGVLADFLISVSVEVRFPRLDAKLLLPGPWLCMPLFHFPRSPNLPRHNISLLYAPLAELAYLVCHIT